METRIKELEEKLRVQIPGHCNRCRKFLQSRNIEETKVLIGAGQFKDPFNLYEMGFSDLLSNYKMQEDIEYKIKYGEVWDNRRKIEEKLNNMMVESDKRSFGIDFTVSEIEKLEVILKNIAAQFSSPREPIEKRDNIFKEKMAQLTKIIYMKVKEHQMVSKVDQETQTEVETESKTDENSKNHDKSNKKLLDFKKKLALKEKEITCLTEKIKQYEEQNTQNQLEKNSTESVMKNLISQHVEELKMIENLKGEKKEQENKISFLQKEIGYLKSEVENLYEQLSNVNIGENNKESSVNLVKGVKSSKHLKSKKYIKIEKEFENEEKYMKSTNLKNKWRSSNESSFNDSMRKSRVRDSVRRNRNESFANSQHSASVENLDRNENLDAHLSKKSMGKRGEREKSAFSTNKNKNNDEINENEMRSRVSIALEDEVFNDQSENQFDEQPKSVKRSRNLVKSVRKIQRSKKTQLELEEQEEDPGCFLMEGNLTTVSSKKIKLIENQKSKTEVSLKNDLETKEYGTQTTDEYKEKINQKNEGVPKEENVEFIKSFSKSMPLEIKQNKNIQKAETMHNRNGSKQKLMFRSPNGKIMDRIVEKEEKEEKIVFDSTLPTLNQSESLLGIKVSEKELKKVENKFKTEGIEKQTILSELYKYYGQKIHELRNQMQFQGSFKNVSHLSLENFECYFNQFLESLMTKEQTGNNQKKSAIRFSHKAISGTSTPKNARETFDRRLEPLTVQRITGLNERSIFSNTFSSSGFNFISSNGFAGWDKNSENSTYISPLTTSALKSAELTPEMKINKEKYLSEISEKLCKMYFSPDEALKIEKAKFISNYSQKDNSDGQSVSLEESDKKTIEETDEVEEVKEKVEKKQRLSKKSISKSVLKSKSFLVSDILSSKEIKFMNIIMILLMKLHDTFPEAYITVKNILTKPYSFQKELKKEKISSSIEENEEKEKIEAKEKDSEIEDNEEESPIREGISKLIILHRRCLLELNFRNHGKTNSTHIKKEVATKNQSKGRKERSSAQIPEKQSLFSEKSSFFHEKSSFSPEKTSNFLEKNPNFPEKSEKSHNFCQHLQELQQQLHKYGNVNFKNSEIKNNQKFKEKNVITENEEITIEKEENCHLKI